MSATAPVKWEPDPTLPVKPFRHPYISGKRIHEECGRAFEAHGWLDCGSHGFTICPFDFTPNKDELELNSYTVLREPIPGFDGVFVGDLSMFASADEGRSEGLSGDGTDQEADPVP